MCVRVCVHVCDTSTYQYPPVTLPLSLYPDLAGPGLMEQHCAVEHIDGVVMLHPKHGECYINYEQVTQPTKLNQGKQLSHKTLLLLYQILFVQQFVDSTHGPVDFIITGKPLLW